MRLPVWFQAPDEPITTHPIRVDADTTARRFTFRAILAARRYTFPAAALTMTHQIGEALVPVIMGTAIDRAIATGDTGQLLLWVALLGADFAFLSYSYRFGSRIGFLGMQSVQHMLRTTVTDRLLDPRGLTGELARPGIALSIATSDVAMVARTMALGIYPVGAFAGVVFCAIVLLTISWPLGLAILVGAPLLLVVLDKAGGPLERRTEKQQALAADAAGRATDLVSGYRVIKGIGAEEEAARRYRDSSREALAGTVHAKTAEGIYLGSMNLLTGLFIAVLAVVAGLLAWHGQLTVGQLITVVGLTQFIISPLESFAMLVGAYWPTGLASATRVLSVLNAPHALPEPTDDTPLSPTGELTLDNVTAGALHNFDLRVAPGELVGIDGEGEPAGALADVLMLRRVPDTGTIRWAGDPLTGKDPQQVREHVLVAPHSADLFDGSIVDNVALPGTDPDRVAAALTAAGVDDFLDTLPDGPDTPVGEGGIRLSGGQRQRVALARALAQPAPLVVLHDPTTAVDSVTEAGIADRLSRIRRGTATVVITTSPALLAACDRVVRLPGSGDDRPTEPGPDAEENR